jgi:hypothetical protein
MPDVNVEEIEPEADESIKPEADISNEVIEDSMQNNLDLAKAEGEDIVADARTIITNVINNCNITENWKTYDPLQPGNVEVTMGHLLKRVEEMAKEQRYQDAYHNMHTITYDVIHQVGNDFQKRLRIGLLKFIDGLKAYEVQMEAMRKTAKTSGTERALYEKELAQSRQKMQEMQQKIREYEAFAHARAYEYVNKLHPKDFELHAQLMADRMQKEKVTDEPQQNVMTQTPVAAIPTTQKSSISMKPVAKDDFLEIAAEMKRKSEARQLAAAAKKESKT